MKTHQLKSKQYYTYDDGVVEMTVEFNKIIDNTTFFWTTDTQFINDRYLFDIIIILQNVNNDLFLNDIMLFEEQVKNCIYEYSEPITILKHIL